MMNKSDLRQSCLTYLKELDATQRQRIGKKLLTQLTALDSWRQATTIGVTISQGVEWDTRSIIETAWQQGKTVCVPKCLSKEKQLVFYQLDTYEQLENVYIHLLEPNPHKTTPVLKEQIELLLVPGLLFNKQGFRIGFGGGYYDRFLQDFSNETISLTSENQVMEYLPVEPFDIPVHQILTENGPIKEEL